LAGLLTRREGVDGLWLALDTVQDPQNLGALFRLAGFFGIIGIVMTRDKSAPMTETVCDVSAGGVEHVAFSQVTNLAQAMQTVQKSGIWILGTCERSTTSIRDVPRDRPWMLVVGNESDGLRRLTREKCDQLCSLPPNGPVSSLNVATAAAACLTVLSTPAQAPAPDA
jgi:23S rRNA (guanosine2251-2'-O)-methyltransferase